MEMQESRSERQKICRIAYVLDEHNTSAWAQASLGFLKPGAPFLFTSQFMNGQQTEYNVRRSRDNWPRVVTRCQGSWSWGKHGPRPANRRFCHSLAVKVIEKLPAHVGESAPKFDRRFIKPTMAENGC